MPNANQLKSVRTATFELNQITNAKFVGVSRLEIGDWRFEIYCTDESRRLNKSLKFLPIQDSCQKASIRFWVRSIDFRF